MRVLWCLCQGVSAVVVVSCEGVDKTRCSLYDLLTQLTAACRMLSTVSAGCTACAVHARLCTPV
jgi:hypothetical protein